jgi:hypothetical protein
MPGYSKTPSLKTNLLPEMKAVIIILAAVAALNAIPLHARIGENISECTKRYGEAIFRHDEGDWSFRTFDFSNKTIKVFYYNSRSVFELITAGEINFLSEQQAQDIIAKEAKFYLGLLGGAYGFTEAELEKALKLQQTQSDTTEASVSSESFFAEFKILIDESKRSIKVIMSVGDGLDFKKSMQDTELAKNFQKFLADSLKLEDKSKKTKAAEGF